MNEIQGVRNTIPRWLGTRGRVLQVAQHQATHASCLGAISTQIGAVAASASSARVGRRL